MVIAQLPIILEERDLEEGLIEIHDPQNPKIPNDTNLCECCNGPWCRYLVPCMVGLNVVVCTGLLIFVILGYVLGDRLIK